MNKITNLLIKAYSCGFYIGPLVMTALTMLFLVVPYNSTGNFDLETTLFTFLVMISTALLLLFLYQLINGKKEYRLLSNMSFLSMLFSMLSIMLLKTSISLWPIPIMFVTVNLFLFYAMLREVCNHLK